MLVRCPRCASAIEVAAEAKEAVCSSCHQSFNLLAEAETRTEGVTAEQTSAPAPPISRPQVRVNCFQCSKEFLIPLGDTEAVCPQCGAPYSLTEKHKAGAERRPRAKTVVTGEGAPPSRETTAESDEASLRWLQAHVRDRYDVIGFISRGGMGAVYRAHQKQLGRDVALKVMLAGAFASASHRSRFEREARAVANLRHPAIVPVYEYGEVGGLPYFTMEFVEGTNLRAYVLENGLSREEICRLMVRVCDAIHYAHTHGVIHRDLKPGNIMVDVLRRPRILDFGLSRTSMQGGDRLTALTVTGELMGTPHYMSPEQAGGRPRDVDERADVYALGVILYELIVGVLPYPIEHARGLQVLDVLRAARPLRPSALHPAFPADLEIILLKAIEKDKGQRYPSAEALAQDLESWLAGRPISARRPTVSYRLNRWAWRNRKVLAPVAVLLAVIVALTAVYWRGLVGLLRSKRELEARWTKFERFLGRAGGAAAGVDELVREDQWQDALDLARFAPRYFPDETGLDYLEPKVRRCAEKRIESTLSAFASALRAQDYADARKQADALTALAGRMPYDDLRKRAAEVATAFEDLCWQDAKEGMEFACTRYEALARADRFTEGLPGSPHAAEAKALRARLAGEPADYFFAQHGKAVERAMSALDWPAAEQVIRSAEGMVADGQATASEDRRQMLGGWRRRLETVIRAEAAARLRPVQALKTPAGQATEHRFVKSLAFSPDGSYLAVGAINATLSLWRTADWGDPQVFQMAAAVRSIAFSPDGRLLAAGLEDGTVSVQSFPEGQPQRSWHLESENWVTSLAFSRDRQHLLAASVKGAVVFDLGTGQKADLKRVAGRSPAALSPDGRLLAVCDAGAKVHLWELKGEYQAGAFESGAKPLLMAFSPDGATLAIVYDDETCVLRDVETGRIVVQFVAGKMRVQAAAFSADGKLLATGGVDKVVALWDAKSAGSIRALAGHATWITSIAFSPDGRTMATGGNDGQAVIWAVGLPAEEPDGAAPAQEGAAREPT